MAQVGSGKGSHSCGLLKGARWIVIYAVITPLAMQGRLKIAALATPA